MSQANPNPAFKPFVRSIKKALQKRRKKRQNPYMRKPVGYLGLTGTSRLHNAVLFDKIEELFLEIEKGIHCSKVKANQSHEMSAKMFVAVADKMCGEPYGALESMRICYGMKEVEEYQRFIDKINEYNPNFNHDMYYRELPSDAIVAGAKYVVVELKNEDRNCGYYGEPDLDTVRMFPDMKRAMDYVAALPSEDDEEYEDDDEDCEDCEEEEEEKEVRHCAIIELSKLTGDYKHAVAYFPDIIKRSEIMYVPRQ